MTKILNLSDFKKIFDREFFSFLREKRQEAKKIHPDCALLIDEIIRLNRAGGKRIRPYICYLGYCLAGNTETRTIPQVCFAPELMESTALIHDDIMDEADIRRGEPTIYKKYGRDMAILAGDLLFSFMDEAMLDAGKQAQKYFAMLKGEIVCGQYLDNIKDNDKTAKSICVISEKQILHIYHFKSASYTVKRPLQMGYLAGINKWDEKNKKVLEILDSFGRKAGVGFQIADDLIDLLPETQTGKIQGGDIRQGKITYWLIKLWQKAGPGDKNELIQIYSKTKKTVKDIERVIKLAKSSGAIKEARQKAQTLANSAQKDIITIDKNNPAVQRLSQMAEFLVSRKY